VCRNVVLWWVVVAAGLNAWAQTLSGSAIIPNGDNWFDHPEVLCAALQQLGYHAGTWGKIGGSPVYICSYPPDVRPSDSPAAIDAILATAVPPAPLSLAFEVSGLRSRQADSIRIAITIPTPEAIATAKKLMVEFIKSLYQVIGQKVPAALTVHVQNEQPYLFHQRYGTAAFRITSKPKQQIFWFYLHRNP
jgi:hypothetical protein